MTTGVRAAIENLEKENASLEPELLTAADARRLMSDYARAERLVAFGIATLSRKLDDPSELAKVTGTTAAKARDVVATGKTLSSSDELNTALQTGAISMDQATEIATAEASAPGSAQALVAVAQTQPFNVLREKARKTKLEAESHRGLAARQHEARRARSYPDDLGMVHIHIELEPHVGTPLVARAEAEAQRIAKDHKAAGTTQPFERYLADAYAALLAGKGKGRTTRPELVVLVSHEVAKRGWTDVRDGEVCKIPGVGPIGPGLAKQIAQDAFINAVVCNGIDLRNFKRWSRAIPIEVKVALELGEVPDFDGVACVDCGNRFRTEFDHLQPRFREGPTSQPNLKPRCWSCHQAKTRQDKKKERRTKPP